MDNDPQHPKPLPSQQSSELVARSSAVTVQLSRRQVVPSFRDQLRSLWAAIKTSPKRNLHLTLGATLIYSIAALAIGFSSGIYKFQLLDVSKVWFLPVTLLLFPSIPEEFFFRGLLIPRDAATLPWQRSAAYVVFSAFAFTVWHPLNALTVNPTAQPFFCNVYFLIICFLLGLTCGASYLASRSIWVPVIIHWLTVIVWVFALGGRNLILEAQ